MVPHFGPAWTDFHQIWAVEVFNHALPIYSIQNADIKKKIAMSSLWYLISSNSHKILWQCIINEQHYLGHVSLCQVMSSECLFSKLVCKKKKLRSSKKFKHKLKSIILANCPSFMLNWKRDWFTMCLFFFCKNLYVVKYGKFRNVHLISQLSLFLKFESWQVWSVQKCRKICNTEDKNMWEKGKTHKMQCERTVCMNLIIFLLFNATQPTQIL